MFGYLLNFIKSIKVKKNWTLSIREFIPKDYVKRRKGLLQKQEPQQVFQRSSRKAFFILKADMSKPRRTEYGEVGSKSMENR